MLRTPGIAEGICSGRMWVITANYYGKLQNQPPYVRTASSAVQECKSQAVLFDGTNWPWRTEPLRKIYKYNDKNRNILSSLQGRTHCRRFRPRFIIVVQDNLLQIWTVMAVTFASVSVFPFSSVCTMKLRSLVMFMTSGKKHTIRRLKSSWCCCIRAKNLSRRSCRY